jgi:hypothetical protein
MALFVRMIIIAVNMTLHNNIFRSNSYIILICVMCLWPGLVVDTRYNEPELRAISIIIMIHLIYLYRQKISNSVKRKAEEDISVRPTKLIHREIKGKKFV